MPSGLTAKQERFVQEFLVDLNATQAAVRAGYSLRTAGAIGGELLQAPKVRAAILAAMTARGARLQITQDRVLDELAVLALSDIRNYIVDEKGMAQLAPGVPPAAMAAVASVKRKSTSRGSGKWKRTEIEVEIKLWDKPTTLKLAGQHVGLFADRFQVTGRGGGPIEVAAVRAMSTEDLIASTKRLIAKAEEQVGV